MGEIASSIQQQIIFIMVSLVLLGFVVGFIAGYVKGKHDAG